MLYKRGTSLIDPYMTLANRGVAKTDDREAHLQAGIACLDRVLALSPTNWAAFWMRGKALQALGEHPRAVKSFASAYDIQPINPDVGREYVLELLETRAFSEAVSVSQTVVQKHPHDAGLLANLALAQVLDRDVQHASRTIADALVLEPRDPVTMALKRRIEDIAAGRRNQPQSIQELEAPGD
jgi:Flp pilus assembly protein TadD